MKGFVDNIESRTKQNSDFRRVLYTAKHMQLVLMSLEPGEDIGEEIHEDADQFFRVEKGRGEVWIDGKQVGETPIGNFAIPVGPHEVLFKHPELGEKRHAVVVSANTITRLSIDLRK